MKMLELNNAKLNLDDIDQANDEGQKNVECLPGSIILINPAMIVDIRRKNHYETIRGFAHGKISLRAQTEVTFLRVSAYPTIVEYLVYQDLNAIKSLLHLI